MIADKTTRKTDKYVLDDNGNPVPEPDLMAWGTWMQTGDRTIKKTKIGDIKVSTVFLGLDHNYLGQGPPLLYETMCFRADGQVVERDDCFARYSTRAEALAGHEQIVESVRPHAPNRKD